MPPHTHTLLLQVPVPLPLVQFASTLHPQRPLTQTRAAVQSLPQLPQRIAFVLVFVSQPSSEEGYDCLTQSENPVAQVCWHTLTPEVIVQP